MTKSDSLTVGLNIDESESGLSAELDSPDQYSVGLEVHEFKYIDSLVSFLLPNLNASFSGFYDEGCVVIRGIFKQNGRSFNLVLGKGAERKRFNRPQTPAPPFPYEIEEIAFRDRKGRFQLISGTLTSPDKPKALVVFISGSGWQDRDETLFAHKPFAVLSDALSRAGYATFRYDDFPAAIFQKSTTYDFADAVQLIIDSLKTNPKLKNLKTGLLGHSEGSLVAFVAASENSQIDFTVHLGGISMHIYDILSYQIRALAETDSTVPDEIIDNSVKISQELYRVVRKSKNTDRCIGNLAKKWDEITEKLTPEECETYKMTPENKFTSIYSLSSPWYFTLFHIEPGKYLKKVKGPVLAISGEKDKQVPTEESLKRMRKYLKRNRLHKFYALPGANHLLQPCTSGAVKEYAEIETTVSEEAIDAIIRWLEDAVGFEH